MKKILLTTAISAGLALSASAFAASSKVGQLEFTQNNKSVTYTVDPSVFMVPGTSNVQGILYLTPEFNNNCANPTTSPGAVNIASTTITKIDHSLKKSINGSSSNLQDFLRKNGDKWCISGYFKIGDTSNYFSHHGSSFSGTNVPQYTNIVVKYDGKAITFIPIK